MGKSSDAEGVKSDTEQDPAANHLAQAISALPAHTQPLTGEGTGYSHKRVAPKIGPVLRATDFDRVLHAWIGRLTGGVAPTALALAYLDWVGHLAIQPGKQSDLLQTAWEKFEHLCNFALRCALHYDQHDCAELRDSDARFRTESWSHWPFNVYAEAFLLGEEWWQLTTSTVQGVSQHHRDLMSFLARQLTDTCSPSNFPWSNPDILRTTQVSGGANLLHGALHAI